MSWRARLALATAALILATRFPHAQTAGKMRTLFDGTSMDAWRGYSTGTVPDGWRIAEGELAKDGRVGDLVSKDAFADFELELEWKIGEAGNSGIFYRATEEYSRLPWSAAEYQLLDDEKAADNKTRLTCAGADYGIYPSLPGHLKPAREWNATKIVAVGTHIEHWLNGAKVVEYEIGSADWLSRVAASKFAAWPHYGLAPKGRIGVQGDHEGTLALRNIRIRELK